MKSNAKRKAARHAKWLIECGWHPGRCLSRDLADKGRWSKKQPPREVFWE